MSAINISRNDQYLSGGGEMGALIRRKDWSKTPVGDPENWPQSLQIALSILLHSKFPMFLWWGPELICFYNDAYRFSLGENGKHPAILGMPAEEAWPEIWDIIKPLINQVMAGGEATWHEDQLIPIYRNGKMEEVYWTFSYSPVKDDSWKVSGVLVTCSETTEKIITQKKLEENKNQLQFAIDAADLATWDLDIASNRFTGNDRLKEWHGLSVEDSFDLAAGINRVAENDREGLKKAIEHCLDFSSGGILDHEYSIINPVTQQTRIVRAKGKATFGEDKTASRLNGILIDVTHQVLSRKKTEQSEERFQAAVSAVQGILWTNNARGEMEGHQPGWESLTGQRYADYQGFGWTAAVHPEDAQPTVDEWNKAVAGRSTFVFWNTGYCRKMEHGAYFQYGPFLC